MTPKRSIGRPHRRVARRGPELKTIHVVGEGQETEPRYFQAYRRHYGGRLNIDVAPHSGVTAPRQLVEQACDLRSSLEKPDRLDPHWVVLDRENRSHAEIEAVRVLAHRHGIKIAVSTPCIEQWFLLHLDEPLRTGYVEASAVCRDFYGKVGGTKRLSSDVTAMLVANAPRAVERAREIERWHDENGNPATHNPSSGLWRLIAEFDALARPLMAGRRKD